MFRFSLQTVLDVRERFEKIKHKEYAAELLVFQGLEMQREALLGNMQRAAHANNQAKQSSISAMPFILHEHYRERLKKEVALLDGRIQEQKERVDLKRRELVEARRSHKALDILRSKEKIRFLQAEEKRERIIMDEVAATHHIMQV